MSQRNGDKSRYNRERKQNIHRRTRTRELLSAEAQGQSGGNRAADRVNNAVERDNKETAADKKNMLSGTSEVLHA